MAPPFASHDAPPIRIGKSWLTEWKPEDQGFWASTGRAIAWRTLILTTLTLVLSFSTWFVMSALVVRLPAIGFKFTDTELYWLAAMPGLAGGTLRIIHTFLIPIFGTRLVITVATLLKIIPCLMLGFAVMNPETTWWTFMFIAFLIGMGGGDFSSYMPSTSLFFPKRLQGTALGIQAGIGNFGVSLTQFVTPWIISFAALGATVGGPQVFTNKKTGATSDIWLQNAAFWYVPLLLIFAIACWFMLRSVPVKATFRQQLDIFKSKHTWFCTVTYVMTFGSFSGLSAAFPMMIKSLYGGFPDAPDPLKYAFYGPLIGSASRVLFGFVADKTGGGILTHLTGIGMIGICIALIATGAIAPTSGDTFPLFVGLMLCLFFLAGVGNAVTFRQYPVIFAQNPRQGAGVLGWTGAVAAYGPFLFSVLIGAASAASVVGGGTKSAATFFIGLIAFYVVATGINWWYYVRKGCERPS